MSTRYFALIGIEPAPSGLMREVRDAEELALEYLDGQGNWVFDASLVKYPLLGEHDAVLIDEAAALALAQELTLGQGMKEAPPPPDREVEEEHYAAVLEKALAAVRRRVERWLREHEAEGQKHLPGKHDQRTHGRGGIGLDPGSITQEREGLFLREGLPGGGHILLTRGTDRGVAEANLRDINEALGIVPKEHIQGLNKVLAEMGDPRLFGSEAYIGSDDAIWLSDAWSAKGRTDRVQGIVHEIGHRYQTRISPKSFSEFRKAGLGKHVESLIKPEFLSNYPKGEKRDAEAFAESYARFHQKKSLPSDLQTFWSRSGQKALFAKKQLSLGLLNLSDDPEFWATVKEDFLADIAKADPPVSAARLMQRGAAEAASLGLAVDFSLVNEQALETAAKYTNEWWQALEGSTRDGLRKAIQTNIETGAPLRGLIKDIEPLFGKGRASMVAATEVTRLYAEGNRFAYASAGIQQVEWKTVRDTLVDPLCDELNGDRWPLGQEQFVPPRHVNCRCRLVPVVDDEALPEPDDIVAWDPKGVGGILNYKPQLGRYHDQLRESLGKDVYIHSAETRSSLKTKVVGDIAARSGLSLRRVNEFVKTWALTSSDNSLDAIALQYVAGRKFNVSLTGFIDGTADAFARGREGSAWRLATAESERFLDAVYAQTQEMLARWGIKEFYLGRGISGSEFTSLPEVLEYKRKQAAVRMGRRFYTEDIDFKSNPLSSWSVDAKVYGTWDSHVLFAKVPASRILSTPFTGFGCLNEFEFVVVGGLDTVRLGFGSGQWSNYFLGGVEELI